MRQFKTLTLVLLGLFFSDELKAAPQINVSSPVIEIRLAESNQVLQSGVSIPTLPTAAPHIERGYVELKVKNLSGYDLLLIAKLSAPFRLDGLYEEKDHRRYSDPSLNRLAPQQEKTIRISRELYPTGLISGALSLSTCTWNEQGLCRQAIVYQLQPSSINWIPDLGIQSSHRTTPSHWFRGEKLYFGHFIRPSTEDIWELQDDGKFIIYGNQDTRPVSFGKIGEVKTNLTRAEGWGLDESDIHIADATGDGLSDIITLNRFGVLSILKNVGGNFQFWSGMNTPYTEANGWFDANLADQVMTGDVNGDGRADMIFHRANGIIDVLLSDGNQFNYVGATQTNMTFENGWFNSRYKPLGVQRLIGDVTGDLKDDFVAIDDFGNVRILAGTPNGFRYLSSTNLGLQRQVDTLQNHQFYLANVECSDERCRSNRKELVVVSTAGDMSIYQFNSQTQKFVYSSQRTFRDFREQGFFDGLKRLYFVEHSGQRTDYPIFLNNYGAFITAEIDAYSGHYSNQLSFRVVGRSTATTPTLEEVSARCSIQNSRHRGCEIPLRSSLNDNSLIHQFGRQATSAKILPNSLGYDANDLRLDSGGSMEGFLKISRATYRGAGAFRYRLVDRDGNALTPSAVMHVYLED